MRLTCCFLVRGVAHGCESLCGTNCFVQPTVQEDGMIYGRGIQDMKSVGVQYVEAVSRLKGEGFIPSRNIHLLFVPDEEIGGVDGMEAFIASEQYKSIQPVAFALDEGLANPNDAFTVFYGERVPWWFYVKATGPTGHGSRFIKNTATSKIIDVCNKALAFRAEQEALLSADCGCKHGDIKKRNLGDVTTINLNMLRSGVSQDGGKTHALNVIPTEAVAGFDVRISPDMDLKKFKASNNVPGGAQGMGTFIETEQFKAIQPVAFAFDEGLANPGDVYTVFYGERAQWWVYVKAEGPTGHGSRFIKNTATSKIIDICNKALAFREEQEKILNADAGCKHGDMKKKKLGDVTSINITALQSGVSQDGGKTHALNVIPTNAIAGFDIRISPEMDISAMGKKLDEWCAAEGVSWEFASWTKPMHEHYVTSLDNDNIWWQLFQKSCARIGEKIEMEIFPAATDSRYLRKAGVQAIGFSPMKKTEILLHEHNEYLHKDTFLHGIKVYETIFRDVFAHK
ncbi:Peptidase M20, dimerization domain [Phytophthora cactorum]|nr:Peptidase M20, dimerization domain [Phytophthora cactorum]